MNVVGSISFLKRNVFWGFSLGTKETTPFSSYALFSYTASQGTDPLLLSWFEQGKLVLVEVGHSGWLNYQGLC